MGYVAFLDPPKDSAAPAILALKNHGVAVKVLTGDNELVSRKICQEVGLSPIASSGHAGGSHVGRRPCRGRRTGARSLRGFRPPTSSG